MIFFSDLHFILIKIVLINIIVIKITIISKNRNNKSYNNFHITRYFLLYKDLSSKLLFKSQKKYYNI